MLSIVLLAVALLSAVSIAAGVLVRRSVLSEQLRQAIDSRDLPAIHDLLAAGADPNTVSHLWRQTALSCAVSSGRLDIAMQTLAHGGLADDRTLAGYPVLVVAVGLGADRALVEALVRGGASVRRTDAEGRDAAFYARQWNRSALPAILEAMGVPPVAQSVK